jgi:hypothetical protein
MDKANPRGTTAAEEQYVTMQPEPTIDVKEPSSIYSSHISYGQRWRVVAADDTYD